LTIKPSQESEVQEVMKKKKEKELQKQAKKKAKDGLPSKEPEDRSAIGERYHNPAACALPAA
jgi:hypothetical protein